MVAALHIGWCVFSPVQHVHWMRQATSSWQCQRRSTIEQQRQHQQSTRPSPPPSSGLNNLTHISVFRLSSLVLRLTPHIITLIAAIDDQYRRQFWATSLQPQAILQSTCFCQLPAALVHVRDDDDAYVRRDQLRMRALMMHMAHATGTACDFASIAHTSTNCACVQAGGIRTSISHAYVYMHRILRRFLTLGIAIGTQRTVSCQLQSVWVPHATSRAMHADGSWPAASRLHAQHCN